jgi:peroxiredoxin
MGTDTAYANPKVGDRAPQFAVLDSTGTQRTLTELVAAGPRVFVFYRGHW